MSKYFDQTVRARDASLPLEAQRAISMPSFPDAAIAPADSSSALADSRVEKCQVLSMSVANISHLQFKGSEQLEPAEESYRALRTRLLRLRLSRGVRSVVITSAVRGEGKTLTSLNLALCTARLQEMRVLLVDADVRTRGLSERLGCQLGPGLAEILSGDCQPEEVIRKTDIPNLFVLSSGTPNVPSSELFASRRWQEFVGWCNESFKLTLFDSPPVLNLADVELITAGCDGVLVVVRAQSTKREILQKCAGQLDAKKILGVVYNGADGKAYQKYRYPAVASRQGI